MHEEASCSASRSSRIRRLFRFFFLPVRLVVLGKVELLGGLREHGLGDAQPLLARAHHDEARWPPLEEGVVGPVVDARPAEELLGARAHSLGLVSAPERRRGREVIALLLLKRGEQQQQLEGRPTRQAPWITRHEWKG